jgi:hypothetical protein
MSEKFVQLTSSAKSSGLATDYLPLPPHHTNLVNAFGRDALHIDFSIGFKTIRRAMSMAFSGISAPRHHGPSRQNSEEESSRDSSLVANNREIPEVVQWYIADRFLQPTERLNELLEGRVSSWVDDMRSIRGRARASWRILREVNRTMLAVPERLAYEAYHAVLDLRLWFRWRQFQKSYISDSRGAMNQLSCASDRN